MKRTLSLLALLLVVACTSDMHDRDRHPQGYPGGDRGGFAQARAEGAGDGLELMPPSDWWHDPRISVAVNLTPNQLASLDRISHDQSEEIAKLERDSMMAARDLRQTVESNQPAAND